MATDPRIGTTIKHYEVTAKLGAGGMGDVYRAHDTKLGRDVALKILPPHLAERPGWRTRFEREARAIAALRHPNIVTIYSVEEADGVLFLTMECIEGTTLGSLIPKNGLPLDRFFALAIPLADALVEAHGKSITHRDLKPANVMVDTDGRVKILDFGLAKLLEPDAPTHDPEDARTAPAEAPTTEDGRILGTLVYMSPEQAEGKPVDHRSDLFSLGVLYYEMATGRRPFAGDTTASTIAAILRDEPPSVAEVRADVPRHLARIINRCLDKDPARRFQSTADLRVELENLRTESDADRPAVGTGSRASAAAARRVTRAERKLPLAPIIASVVALLIAGFFGARELGWIRDMSLVSAGVLDKQDRILIADFDNTTDDPLLGDALREALLVDLSQSPVVKIVPNGTIVSTLALMGKPADTRLDGNTAREVALRDGIKAVVVGQISPVTEGYVLTARLLHADTGNELAAERAVARTSGDLIDAIDELSRKLRERIGESLRSVRAGKPLEHVTTHSLVALQKYSQAIRINETTGDLDRALALLEEAVHADSTFAMAHRKIGILLGNNFDFGPRHREALTKAYELRDRLTDRERYLAIAAYHAHIEPDEERETNAYRQMLDLDPSDPWALNNLANILRNNGQLEQAADMYQRAVDAGPSTLSISNLAATYVALGRFDESESTAVLLTRTFPDAKRDLYLTHATRVWAQYDFDAADSLTRAFAREAVSASDRELALGSRSTVALVRGQRDLALEIERELVSSFADDPLDFIYSAMVLARIRLFLEGDADAARRELDRILERHPLADIDPAYRPHLDLARAYAMTGDAERATALVAQHDAVVSAGQQSQDDSRPTVLGWIALAEDRALDAVAHFRDARTGSPLRPRDSWMVANAYDQADMPDSALAGYERYLYTPALYRFSWDRFFLAPTLRRMGELYQARGESQKALAMYEQLLDQWKDADPDLHARLRPVEARVQALRNLDAGESQSLARP